MTTFIANGSVGQPAHYRKDGICHIAFTIGITQDADTDALISSSVILLDSMTGDVVTPTLLVEVPIDSSHDGLNEHLHMGFYCPNDFQ